MKMQELENARIKKFKKHGMEIARNNNNLKLQDWKMQEINHIALAFSNSCIFHIPKNFSGKKIIYPAKKLNAIKI